MRLFPSAVLCALDAALRALMASESAMAIQAYVPSSFLTHLHDFPASGVSSSLMYSWVLVKVSPTWFSMSVSVHSLCGGLSAEGEYG